MRASLCLSVMISFRGLFSFLSLAVLSLVMQAATVGAAGAETYQAFSPKLQAGAAYFIAADQLHPTQFSVGWREVVAKRKAIEAKDAAKLLAYLKNKDVPVVIGPGGVPYMTDGHHTTLALLSSSQPEKNVYGHILENWSDLDSATFWARMQERHYAFLEDENGRAGMLPEALPASLRQMRRDPYRGLTWAVMNAGGFKERKDVFFQEFLWADYLRDKVRWDDADDAAFAAAVKKAVALCQQPEAAGLPGYPGRK